MILVAKWVAVARHGLKLWENDAIRLINIFRPLLGQKINLKIKKSSKVCPNTARTWGSLCLDKPVLVELQLALCEGDGTLPFLEQSS